MQSIGRTVKNLGELSLPLPMGLHMTEKLLEGRNSFSCSFSFCCCCVCIKINRNKNVFLDRFLPLLYRSIAT